MNIMYVWTIFIGDGMTFMKWINYILTLLGLIF